MRVLQGHSISQDRIWLLFGLALLVLLTGVGIYARPLTPIDETRYISVAWEMWLRGDYLVPIKNGLPYSDKPPLLMWLYQAGWALFGVNEWWPRLVSPLFSAASLWLVYRLAQRLWPALPGVAGATVLVLSSSLLWILFSTAAMFDVMLAFFTLVGIHGTLSAARGQRSGFAVLAVAIGLGILAKGPVILLHTLPVAVLALWWQPGLAWRGWFGGLVVALLIGAGIALAWAIPAGIAGGESYQHAIFWGQTADRMVKSFAHQRPFWWYLPALPLLLFPWLLLPAAWRGAFQLRREGLDAGVRLSLAWLVPVFIALSLISGKQPHYLIPLFPAFALLVARGLARRPVVGVSWLPAVALLLGGLLLAGALGLVPSLQKALALPPSQWPALALLALAPAIWLLARRVQNSLPVLAAYGALLVALLQLSTAPAIHVGYDVTPLASAIQEQQKSGRVVANDGMYHDQFHFAGRLRTPLVELNDQVHLVTWLQAHPEAAVVMYLKRSDSLEGLSIIAQQSYRGGVAILIDATTALKILSSPVAEPGLTQPAQ